MQLYTGFDMDGHIYSNHFMTMNLITLVQFARVISGIACHYDDRGTAYIMNLWLVKRSGLS